MRRFLIPILLLAPFAPSVAAHESCPEHDPAIYLEAASVYLTPHAHLYEETNGFLGLQRADGVCVDGEGRQWTWIADTRVA